MSGDAYQALFFVDIDALCGYFGFYISIGDFVDRDLVDVVSTYNVCMESQN